MYITAIDSPSGAGKSTIAKLVACELGYLYIDTCAMYKTIALFAIREKLSLNDVDGLEKLAASIEIEFRNLKDDYFVFCNAEDVSDEIRTTDVSKIVPIISIIRPIRKILFYKHALWLCREAL